MRADRCYAIGARNLDPNKLAPVRMARTDLDLHGFLRQRKRNKNKPVLRLSHTIAAMSNADDG